MQRNSRPFHCVPKTVNTDEYKAVLVKWKKVKNARMYQTVVRSTGKEWIKVKTVKKTAKNKKKYTKKKYKLVE